MESNYLGRSSAFESDVDDEVDGEDASAPAAGQESETSVDNMLREGVPAHRNLSVIGKTLIFKGELEADEDLLIQGQVEGTIRHSAANLTIGAHGNLKADIDARSVMVQGQVKGDIRGEVAVIVEPSARIEGNLFAPRIGLKEGAKFKGRIDMDPEARTRQTESPASGASASAESESESESDSASKPKRSSRAKSKSSPKGGAKDGDAVSEEKVDELLG